MVLTLSGSLISQGFTARRGRGTLFVRKSPQEQWPILARLVALYVPQWSADIRLVTGAILLVIPRGGIDHSRSPSMAQTRCCLRQRGRQSTVSDRRHRTIAISSRGRIEDVLLRTVQR